MPQDPSPIPAHMQARLKQSGLRRTLATRALLGLFLASPEGVFSHAQVFQALSARGVNMNRVTLYRLLHRLLSCGLLERCADHTKTTRAGYFSLAQGGAQSSLDPAIAPRFECRICGQHWQLAPVVGQTRAVADEVCRTLAALGHRAEGLAVCVRGTCAACMRAPLSGPESPAPPLHWPELAPPGPAAACG